ncbi:ketosteroid isomerase-like protein [Blastococcus colisei]|uniref:Ketosteroid isomerase-like protein n=1 Tax=Blastococcus colisei TaxID=1564162 RepID=A0A543PGG8_9ACTN|nr:nuclear transport factor 2 family protein [Blastococcus colisei]TQN43146.1 ketosteroid isomerase-like protein [Blastococcus colisei]
MTSHPGDPDDEARRAIERRLDEILVAVQAVDMGRLTDFHLDSPKFSKFNDLPPWERQDFATAMRLEAEEFRSVSDIHGAFDDVKIDVFGPVAVVTAVFAFEAMAEGDRVASRTRVTAVMVDDGGDWKIAHEHLSDLPSPA